MLFAIVGRHFCIAYCEDFRFLTPVSRDIMIGHLECKQFLCGVGLTLYLSIFFIAERRVIIEIAGVNYIVKGALVLTKRYNLLVQNVSL